MKILSILVKCFVCLCVTFEMRGTFLPLFFTSQQNDLRRVKAEEEKIKRSKVKSSHLDSTMGDREEWKKAREKETRGGKSLAKWCSWFNLLPLCSVCILRVPIKLVFFFGGRAGGGKVIHLMHLLFFLSLSFSFSSSLSLSLLSHRKYLFETPSATWINMKVLKKMRMLN